MPLSRKIALLALTNLALLGLVGIVLFQSQFQSGPQSLLAGPVQDRILAIANRFNVELSAMPESAIDGVFASFRRNYQADFFLINPDGEELAGSSVELPDEVLRRIRRPPGDRPPPPPPPRRDGPPPPRKERPPDDAPP